MYNIWKESLIDSDQLTTLTKLLFPENFCIYFIYYNIFIFLISYLFSIDNQFWNLTFIEVTSPKGEIKGSMDLFLQRKDFLMIKEKCERELGILFSLHDSL
jgi:hypothetical protein